MGRKFVDRSSASGFISDTSQLVACLPIVTAALLCVSLTSTWGGCLCFVALIPFACALVVQRTSRPIYAAAYLAGLIVHLVSMAWMLDCYKYGNAIGPFSAEWFWIGTWGGFLFVGAFVLGRLAATRCRIPMAMLLPCIWTACEYIRHEMGAIVTGTAFPWLKLATAVVDHQHLVQVADLGGEYLLTFLVAMINGALVDVALALFRREQPNSTAHRVYAATATLAAVISALCYGYWRLGQSPGHAGPNVVLMGELDLPPLVQPERLKQAVGDRRADLLLWPELAYHHSVMEVDGTSNTAEFLPHLLPAEMSVSPSTEKAQRFLEQTAQQLGATLIIGCERIQINSSAATAYNSLACADPLEGYQGCYDKLHLVPGTETAIRSADFSDGTQLTYNRGLKSRTFRLPTTKGVYRFAPAICYDVCFGEQFQRGSTGAVDFLVQSGAEGQDQSGEIARLMLRYAKLRAIENRRALVRNATLGHSAIIDGNGAIQASVLPNPIDAPMWLGAIPIDRRWSLYACLGDWIAYAACCGSLVLVLISAFYPILVGEGLGESNRFKDVRPSYPLHDGLVHDALMR